jgi:hypothetical protein
MKLIRVAGLFLVLLGAALAGACGGGSHGSEHGAHGPTPTPAPPPPTPDTTPIEALRTPAGLVLSGADARTPAPK